MRSIERAQSQLVDVQLFLILAAIGLAVWSYIQTVWIMRLRRRLRDTKSAKQSQSTRYGQITEQFAPFLASWPWDPKDFRFLGSPIDGVQFLEDEVILVEIKTNQSGLNTKQRRIRDAVAAGRVRFEEVRIG